MCPLKHLKPLLRSRMLSTSHLQALVRLHGATVVAVLAALPTVRLYKIKGWVVLEHAAHCRQLRTDYHPIPLEYSRVVLTPV